MASEIFVLGRYVPGTSPVHRMDPRVKLGLTALAMVALFAVASQNYPGLAVCALFVLAFYALSGISVQAAFKSIGPLLFLVVFVALMDILFWEEGTVLARWWIFCVSTGGLWHALFVSCRLTLLLLVVSLLTLTTPTLDITEAIERVLRPLRRFGVPAHELGMMMAIALRFLPQFVNEMGIIYRAQISRGATVSKGRVRMLSSLVVPLFTSAFRHADTLSSAMEARCYHGGEGRSRLHELRCTRLDAVGLAVVAAMVVCVVVANLMM